MQGTRQQYEGTHLFLVRLQAEELGEGAIQWYGRVQRVVSGETYPFAGWPDLIDRLLAMLPAHVALPALPSPASDKPGIMLGDKE